MTEAPPNTAPIPLVEEPERIHVGLIGHLGASKQGLAAALQKIGTVEIVGAEPERHWPVEVMIMSRPEMAPPIYTDDIRRRNKSDRKRAPRFGKGRR